MLERVTGRHVSTDGSKWQVSRLARAAHRPKVS